VFYREFVDAPPAEVMERIEGGVYFTRAWREYRGLTLADAAELLGKDKTTIIWHESGKTAPKASTLEQFAQVYDCPVAQMTPKPESDDANTKDEAVAGSKARRAMLEPRAPADTDYPDAVLAHLIAGKSPMLAWRLYRNMTLKALAEAYGNTTSNVKAMEANGWLRPTTIDKLCPVFHCKPAQLLRPEGMPTSRETMNELAGAIADAGEVPSQDAVPVRKARAAGEPVASAMEAAFMQAGTLEQRQRDKNRTRHDRLARMQAELARL
jgi:transcriptional regulator with XRE-family HTH domain